jgi:hypothetical protein
MLYDYITGHEFGEQWKAIRGRIYKYEDQYSKRGATVWKNYGKQEKKHRESVVECRADQGVCGRHCRTGCRGFEFAGSDIANLLTKCGYLFNLLSYNTPSLIEAMRNNLGKCTGSEKLFKKLNLLIMKKTFTCNRIVVLIRSGKNKRST